MALYNLKTLSNYYQITKFNENLEVESSYEASEAKCNCPAGSRGRFCRHRQMIKTFVLHGRVNGDWFLDFERNVWVNPWRDEEEKIEPFRRRV